jgi:nitrile hydratase
MAEQFKPGDQVKVRSNIATGHHRTPAFVQGKTGAIELIHGTFGNPDKGGQAEPRQPLYLVSFAQTHIWDGYNSASKDQILLDLYEHWLEPA